MSEYIKTIEVPGNVRKVSLQSAICPKTIEFYTDKLVAKSEKRDLIIEIRNYSRAYIKEAAIKNNSQFAIVFFLTPSEVDLGYQPSITEANSGKVDSCFEFGSGMYSYKEANEYAHSLVNEINEWISQNRNNADNLQESLYSDARYSVKGVRGRSLTVFEDKAIITVRTTLGSIVTGNVTDGQKTIYYSDVIGVQYKPPGITIGYLQLETASTQMNNRRDNFFNENSFTFDKSSVDLNLMNEVAEYVKKRVDENHRIRNTATVIHTQSASSEKSTVDQIKEFKELLDLGIISSYEFETKKQELLGIEKEIKSNDDSPNGRENIGRTDILKSSININPNNIEPTIIRIELFLENREWDKAISYANAALDYFPTDYRLYLYSLCAELKASKADELGSVGESFRDNTNYRMLERFADDELIEKLENYLDIVEKQLKESALAEELNREEERKQSIYSEALSLINNGTSDDYAKAISLLEQVVGWKDTDCVLERCRKEFETLIKKEEIESLKNNASNGTEEEVIEKIKRLKELFDDGTISEDEFNDIKKKLLFANKTETPNRSEYSQAEPAHEAQNEQNNIITKTPNKSDGWLTVISDDIVRLDGFDGEDEWLVLAKEDNLWLLLSKYCQQSGVMTKESNYSWETSEVRKFLNGSFLQRFTEKQRQSLVNGVNTDSNEQLSDLVFLLSEEEYNKYVSKIEPKQYAWKDPNIKLEWALRTGSGNRIYIVNKYGYANTTRVKTLYLGEMSFGIRPAVWIDVSLFE